MLQITSIKTGGRRAVTKKKGATDPLFMYVRDFADFSAGMMVLGDMAPERLTLSQMVFFLLAATADIAGKDPTYTDIKEAVGDKINKSLHTTYRIFLEPSRAYPNGLGWLAQEPSRHDNRVKFLRVTEKGREVLREVHAAIKGE